MLKYYYSSKIYQCLEIEINEYIDRFLSLIASYVLVAELILFVDKFVLKSFIIFQITGVKKWTLTPPPECYWSCGNKQMETTVYPGQFGIIIL